jgi:hypothetical protein
VRPHFCVQRVPTARTSPDGVRGLSVRLAAGTSGPARGAPLTKKKRVC